MLKIKTVVGHMVSLDSDGLRVTKLLQDDCPTVGLIELVHESLHERLILTKGELEAQIRFEAKPFIDDDCFVGIDETVLQQIMELCTDDVMISVMNLDEVVYWYIFKLDFQPVFPEAYQGFVDYDDFDLVVQSIDMDYKVDKKTDRKVYTVSIDGITRNIVVFPRNAQSLVTVIVDNHKYVNRKYTELTLRVDLAINLLHS